MHLKSISSMGQGSWSMQPPKPQPLTKLLPGIINLSHFQLALGHIEHVPRVRRKTLRWRVLGDCRKQSSGC